MRESHILRCTT